MWFTEIDDAEPIQQLHDGVGRVELEAPNREVRTLAELVVVVLEQLTGREEVDPERVLRSVPIVVVGVAIFVSTLPCSLEWRS